MLRKLWKIATIISFCAVLFFGFTGRVAANDNYLEIISDLTKQLEDTNNALIELTNSYDKLLQNVLKLEHENSVLKDENTALKATDTSKERVLEIEKSLEETTQALVDSTDLMSEMTDRSVKDQAEIEDLRGTITDLTKQMDKEKFFGANLGVIYPWGFQVGMNADLPKIPLGFYFNLGLQFVESEPMPLFGGGIRFRF